MRSGYAENNFRGKEKWIKKKNLKKNNFFLIYTRISLKEIL